MKGLLIITVIFIGFAGISSPQGFQVSLQKHFIKNIHFNKDKQASPIPPRLIEMRNHERNRLSSSNKVKTNKLTSVKYLPITAISDDTLRQSYKYDNSGNTLTVLYETKSAGVWQTSFRDSYIYDNTGNMVVYITEQWNGNKWDEAWKETNTYDNNGNKLSDTREFRSNDVWLNSGRDTFSYDGSGNCITMLWENWTNGAWVYDYRFTSTYNNRGSCTYSLTENWINGAWVYFEKTTFTDNDSTQSFIGLWERWNNNSWQNFDRVFSTNFSNNSGNGYTDIESTWTDSGWVNTYRHSGKYDNQSFTNSELLESWNTNSWINSTLVTYVNDIFNNPISNLAQEWVNNDWQNQTLLTFVYDSNGNCINGQNSEWVNGNWTSGFYSYLIWCNNHENYITVHGANVNIEYTTLTSVPNEKLNPVAFNLQQNYPNPFNPSTTINYSLPHEGNVNLTVYNAIGSKVATVVNEFKPAGNYSVQFNGSSLASGIYLYRLESGNYSATKKLILLK